VSDAPASHQGRTVHGEGARSRCFNVAGRRRAADRQSLRSVRCDNMAEAGPLPALQQSGDVRRAAATPRNPGGMDDAGLRPQAAVRRRGDGRDVQTLRRRSGATRRRGARRSEADRERAIELRSGMDVELTFIPFYTDEDGTEIITWPARRRQVPSSRRPTASGRASTTSVSQSGPTSIPAARSPQTPRCSACPVGTRRTGSSPPPNSSA
jgi:hypothetical protein